MTPSYPLLSAAERAAHPPLQLPLVSRCRATDEEVLNFASSALMAALPSGRKLSEAQIAHFEATGEKHPSAGELYADLLPRLTAAGRVYRHAWRPGDVLLWDNERVVHAATWFDAERHAREMWRTTFV